MTHERTSLPPAVAREIENLIDSGWGDSEIRRELEIHYGPTRAARYLDLYYLEMAQ